MGGRPARVSGDEETVWEAGTYMNASGEDGANDSEWRERLGPGGAVDQERKGGSKEEGVHGLWEQLSAVKPDSWILAAG